MDPDDAGKLIDEGALRAAVEKAMKEPKKNPRSTLIETVSPERLRKMLEAFKRFPGPARSLEAAAQLSEKAVKAYDSLASKNLMPDKYPSVHVDSDLARLIDLGLLVKNLDRSFEDTLADRSMNRMLMVSPTTICENACVHCQENAVPKGQSLDYRLLESSDPGLFNLFDRVHLGIGGDPLAVKGTDKKGRPVRLIDYIVLLYQRGIKQFILDAKKINDKGEYRRIQEFFTSTDASLIQRISFNLYSPNIYAMSANGRDVTSSLQAEFMPLLHSSIEFADEIIINVVGSYKYSHSGLSKTFRYLCAIMEEQGFRSVRQHFKRYLVSDQQREEIALCIKYGEPFTMGPSLSSLPSFFRDAIGFMGSDIGGMTTDTEPEGIDIIPNYFVDLDTDQVIKVRYGNALNMGRWKSVADKGGVDPIEPVHKQGPDPPRGICPVFLTNDMFLDHTGNIYRCGGNYHASTRFAHISQPWEKIFNTWNTLHEKLKKEYQANLPGIINGSYNNWVCGKDR